MNNRTAEAVFASHSDWEKWILFILIGVEETSVWTRKKIEGIRSLMSATGDYIQKAIPKTYSYELVSLIFELPYCRIQNVCEKGIAERQAAAKYLKELERVGVLRSFKAGREKLFIHPKLMEMLTSEDNSFKPYNLPKA